MGTTKAIMNLFNPKHLTLVVTAAGMLAASGPVAQASYSYSHNNSINCWNFNDGSPSGDTIFSFNSQTKNSWGNYASSYYCSTYFFNNWNNGYSGYNSFCDIKFNQRSSNPFQGDCSIVFKCSDGKTYSCDINNWNGFDDIKCYNLPRDWQKGCDIEIICKPKCNPPPSNTPPTCVPEPSTLVAGALLLLPFGISTARILRKHKYLPTT